MKVSPERRKELGWADPWEKSHGVPLLEDFIHRLTWVSDCIDGEEFPEEHKNLVDGIALIQKTLDGLKEKAK